MAGIYIHIPFCSRRCHYCDFYSTTDLDKCEKFAWAAGRELERQRNYLGNAPLKSIYFGGGTPSLLRPAFIAGLLDTISSLWDTSSVEEITLEANPDDLSPAYLEELASTSINRLSIGIQSFDDDHLQLMNRRHTAAEAVHAVLEAKKAGFNNITIDLIYGIPGMSEAQWERNILKALLLDVPHISAYHFTIEPETRFGSMAAGGKITAVDEEVSRKQYSMLHDMLRADYYEHYEISNFARPGFRAIHNSSYWTGEPYLGIGPSAHSFNGTERRRTLPDMGLYLNGEDGIYETEPLSAGDMYNEYIMVSLRRKEGVDTQLLAERFGEEKLKKFLTKARRFVAEGVMDTFKGHYRILARHWLVSDAVISDLFEV